ncbi:TonB-dependent receptor [Sphingopyxis granuli]|uniref:TonB-dependent receptor n=1 Tax=Sphingopyxis granuli TaxID=267128 RepID=UPI001F52F5DA|nr:TonB-dependent receptor [Sphingopyxis granuli]UNK81056.1 TonB-dependent receptor [Sphingopyxis granuli]
MNMTYWHKASILAIALGMAQPAFAQESQAASSGEGGSAGTDGSSIADIVVTAQRREQNLQDVPIAVTAIGSEGLANRGVNSVTELNAAVPGLVIAKTSQSVTPFLRGIGNATLTPGNDPSIAVYIDGIYQSAPTSMAFSLNNIERIEVLKGPQGTLFGRNATGGLINIVTRRPQADFSGKVEVGYGNFSTFEGKAYVTGAIASGINADLAVYYRNQSDGWGRNIATPADAGVVAIGSTNVIVPPPKYSDAGFGKEIGLRSSILAELGDNTTFRVAGNFFKSRGDLGLTRHGIAGATLSGDGVTPYVFPGKFWDSATDVSYFQENELWSVSGEFEHELGDVTFKSISGYLHSDTDVVLPTDSTPQVSTSNAGASLPTRTFTQELQLLGSTPTLDWIVGAFYLHSKAGYGPGYTARGALELNATIHSEQITDSVAGYGQVTFSLTDALRATAGLRYTRDKFKASEFVRGERTSTTPAPAWFASGVISNNVPEQRVTQDGWTWRLALDYRVDPDILLYASYNRGFKSGGYNLFFMCSTVGNIGDCPVVNPPVRPEKLDDYEVGVKADLADNMLRLNLSGFYYKYKDIQVQTVIGNPPTTVLTNAASATNYGGEIELVAAPTDGLQINASAALLNAKYDSFQNAIAVVPRTAAPWNNVQLPSFDASGNRLNRAPKFVGTIGFNYDTPVSFGELNMGATLYYNSGFVWDASNRIRQNSYATLNAFIGATLDDSVTVRFWANNLFNQKYYSYMNSSSSGDQGSPAAPRTFGVRVGYEF